MTDKELFDIRIDAPDKEIFKRTKLSWDKLAKPIDGLGDLEELVCRIASIQGKEMPNICKKALIIMCADNGVVCENVTQTDQSVTADVAALMAKRQSSVGTMTADYALDMVPVDIGINSNTKIKGIIDKRIANGTGNILNEPAMSKEQCLEAIKVGMDLVKECLEKGYGLIATGEMGIGNTTTSTAVLCALTGKDPVLVTGKGAGLSDEGLMNKIKVIRSSLINHDLYDKKAGDREQALNTLIKVGGLDIAGLVGVFIGGAIYKIPVVIDGFISAVAAYCANLIIPGVSEYMIASHTGKEKGTALVLGYMKLKALIDADMNLGEGTGAVLIMPMLDMVMSLYKTGTRFGDTTIKEYERFT
ncbi:MAG: nicotinate-nucleotide--dimethylbenzimidazole phosphoribosyltransferase [Lachnospiraceae bacterium]|nr:nicotinate-nucleotide--dimethylbenzimidazole phosphoribosyltransferase [Lachnospiraceae bacterium]